MTPYTMQDLATWRCQNMAKKKQQHRQSLFSGMGVGGLGDANLSVNNKFSALPVGHEMNPAIFFLEKDAHRKFYKEEMCSKHTNSIIAVV